MSLPLSNIKVLDLSRVLAGPWATQMLADLGATVIKIEHPTRGDDTRHWGPPNLPPVGPGIESGYFASANRGKDSVTLDIKTTAGQTILHQLLADCDVLVENFKVDGLKAYGFDYAALAQRYPALIYCSITGFGQTGPYAKQPGYDAIVQALGGLMSITGEADDKPGGGPQKVGVAVADIMTGMYASNAILAALLERQQSGLGQHIDLSLLDCQVAWLANQNMNYLLTGEAPTRIGTAHPNIVPYQTFKTADQHLMLAVGNDAQFQRLCKVIGKPQWSKHPHFATNQARVEHREELVAKLTLILLQQPAAEWLPQLQKANIPCAPINTLAQVVQDPQIKFRQMYRQMVDETQRKIPFVANPINYSRTPIAYTKAAPALGNNTEKVLKALGYSAAAIAELRQDGVIGHF